MSVVQVEAAYNGEKRSVGWISKQPDGAISVGLSDRTFVTPEFRSRNFVWNVDNRQTLEYVVPNHRDTMNPVKNPHLTFHPPIYFHLRENKKVELWAGIADVAVMLTEGGRVPWIRFVSNPFVDLRPISPPRRPEITTTERLDLDSDACSVCLGIDFVRRDSEDPPEWVSRNNSSAEFGVDIEIECHAVPAQVSTLNWYHQC
jgi:hypothetical protein